MTAKGRPGLFFLGGVVWITARRGPPQAGLCAERGAARQAAVVSNASLNASVALENFL